MLFVPQWQESEEFLSRTHQSVRVGQGGGRPPRLDTTCPISMVHRAKCLSCTLLWSGSHVTSLADFSVSCKAFCGTSSFSAAFAVVLLLSLSYQRHSGLCCTAVYFFLNPQSLCCLHGLIEALYIRVRLVDNNCGFAGGELGKWERCVASQGVWGSGGWKGAPRVPALLPDISPSH